MREGCFSAGHATESGLLAGAGLAGIVLNKAVRGVGAASAGKHTALSIAGRSHSYTIVGVVQESPTTVTMNADSGTVIIPALRAANLPVHEALAHV